jgi:histidyl-tRNA synthetase
LALTYKTRYKGTMSNKVQPVRGTQDFLPEQARLYRAIENTAWQTAKLFGYEEISTPIFEFSEVFHRSLGETSDAVSKETYDFTDRGGDSLTLRPEGTAGVVRAFISNGMAQNLPLKLYYSGPMFRYERPQKGRYRQFHQIGVEALGFEDPTSDVECIATAWQTLANLGLSDKVSLEINSLGDKTSRASHREALVQFLEPRKASLSADSQIRLQKNPLRILDSKDDGDKKLIADAPQLQKYLSDDSKKFFDQVLKGLSELGIQTHINSNLVRGLDYYTHTVFEITTTHLGSQGAVISGGRYDGLVEQLGGSATAGVGWGGGLERLMLLADATRFAIDSKLLAVIPADDAAEATCLKLAYDLRAQGHRTELLLSGNVGKKMKRANKLAANFALIIGDSELQQQTVAVKDLGSGEQKTVALKDLFSLWK